MRGQRARSSIGRVPCPCGRPLPTSWCERGTTPRTRVRSSPADGCPLVTSCPALASASATTARSTCCNARLAKPLGRSSPRETRRRSPPASVVGAVPRQPLATIRTGPRFPPEKPQPTSPRPSGEPVTGTDPEGQVLLGPGFDDDRGGRLRDGPRPWRPISITRCGAVWGSTDCPIPAPTAGDGPSAASHASRCGRDSGSAAPRPARPRKTRAARRWWCRWPRFTRPTSGPSRNCAGRHDGRVVLR